MRKTIAIILAGGSGERFKFSIPKQFAKIAGKTILEHTAEGHWGQALTRKVIGVSP